MHPIWLILLLALAAIPDRQRDRAALLAADRELTFADDAAYLHPGARLVRGKAQIRALLDSVGAHGMTWTPEYVDVSDDGTLGYTYGWTRQANLQGKYLACWARQADRRWRIVAYTRTQPAADSATPPALRAADPAPSGRGRAGSDSHELISADSAFSAMSVARGAQAAFVAFSSADAVLLGQGGGPMNNGRDAIAAAFEGFPADAVLEWWPVASHIAGSGDLGCTVGEASMSARNSYSKYVTIWKRQADGSWKFVADGGNARPAP